MFESLSIFMSIFLIKTIFFFTWDLKESLESNQTPKYLITSFDWKIVSSTLTECFSFFKSKFLFEWKWINSILSVSNCMQFCSCFRSRFSANFCSCMQFSSIDFDETTNPMSSTKLMILSLSDMSESEYLV